LAWLNDYELARFICEQTVPVLTGIGHERDSTVLDEVAHARFDTPSKVIAGIEQQILRRSREAARAWEAIVAAGLKAARATRLALERSQAQIQADASLQVAQARQRSAAALSAIAAGAVRQVHDASRQSLALLNQVRADASDEIVPARQRVPALMACVRMEALACAGQARAAMSLDYALVMDRSAAAAQSARQGLDTGMQRVADRAQGAIGQARSAAQALLPEVAGQGPQKTLTRGFAIVRTGEGRLVTSSQQAHSSPTLSIEFRDGSASVRPEPIQVKKTTP
jgi:exodeoxyribonuclease VII large subunit